MTHQGGCTPTRQGGAWGGAESGLSEQYNLVTLTTNTVKLLQTHSEAYSADADDLGLTGTVRVEQLAVVWWEMTGQECSFLCLCPTLPATPSSLPYSSTVAHRER